MLYKTIAAAAMAVAIASPALAKERLRMSTGYPATHPIMTEGFMPWAEKVKDVTEGRVEIIILPKIVGSYTGQYDVAATGQADISTGNQSYTPGRFKQYAFVELPGNGNRAEALSVAFWDTYTEFFGDKDEMSDVKVLTLHTAGPGQLFTTDHVVTTVDGNKGVKVRGGGEAATRVTDTMGMTSVQAPFSKAAEMISNGVVDGAMLDRSLVPVFGFDRYFKNRFIYDGGLYNVSYFMVMNQAKWDKISPEDQAAIDAISGGALARTIGQIWDRLGDQSDAGFEEKGMVTTVAEGALADDLSAAFTAYEQDWIDAVAGDGTDGRAVIDSFRAKVTELEAGL
jgi:TRAP-type C4-dicarboxylate transport system substrate-binding protein